MGIDVRLLILSKQKKEEFFRKLEIYYFRLAKELYGVFIK